MAKKGFLHRYRGIRTSSAAIAGDGFLIKKITVPPQSLVAKHQNRDWVFYSGDGVSSYDSMLGTSEVMGGLKLSRSTPPEVRIFAINFSVALTPKEPVQFVDVEVPALDAPSFSQELIYNGRVGDHVKFLYRESSNGLLRAPFSQELQYDLADGNSIGIKGLRIEVLSATNTSVKYRVIQQFQGDEGLGGLDSPLPVEQGPVGLDSEN